MKVRLLVDEGSLGELLNKLIRGAWNQKVQLCAEVSLSAVCGGRSEFNVIFAEFSCCHDIIQPYALCRDAIYGTA